MLLLLVALLAATLFTGAALYITLVEHPARLSLSEGPMLVQWQQSYRRALPIQSVLALVAAIAGSGAGWMLDDGVAVAGGVAMLANWPFTLVALLPINRRLSAATAGRGDARSHQLLRRWGRLHDVRSLLGAAGMTLLLCAFLQAITTP